MKMISRLLVMANVLLLVMACGNSEIAVKIQELKKHGSQTDYFNGLLDLDQKYPNSGEIKYELGKMLYLSGDTKKAESFLVKGEECINSIQDNSSKQELYVELALLNLHKKEYEQTLAYVEKALAIDENNHEKLLLIKAQTLSLSGKDQDSQAIYDSLWTTASAEFSRVDLNLYYDQVKTGNNNIRVLDVINLYQSQFDYLIGQGVQASRIYEKTGNIREAVLSAVMDLEYLYCQEAASKDDILKHLAEIGDKLKDTQFNPDKQGFNLVTGLQAYYRGDFAQAAEILDAHPVNHHFYHYVLLASKMEAHGASIEELKDFVAYEKYFKTLPGYYYHFWNGMKKGSGTYGLDTVQNILEKCILLSGNTKYANETRIELGRLLGLPEVSAKKLLLSSEIDTILGSVVQGASANTLEPVIELLDIQDNVYTMKATILLRELQHKNPSIKSYLVEKQQKSSGRTKDRLTMILNG